MNERDVFLAALESTDPAARAAYLDEACGADSALRQRVEALLLAAAGPADSFLEVPALEQIAPEAVGSDGSSETGTALHGSAARPPALADLPALEQPRRPESLGRLGHYEVLEIVGRGAFGIVVRAFDDRLHRVVAVKLLAAELAAVGTARQRFLREARGAASVSHENVVDIHAVDEGPVPYLVMEYVAGQTLQNKILTEGALSVKEILRIGTQVADGLAAAHARGLIHRDVKPANILLQNGIERVKITDFGLARTADDGSISGSGVIAGTPQYMSPEQANGEHVDHRSDLFSLGSVLYAMAIGQPPFRASTVVGILKKVAEEDPRPIREANPEIPEWLAAVVTRLHAKKPDERYQSAAEVGEVLRGYLAEMELHGQVTVYITAPPKPKTPPTRRRRAWAWAAAAVVAALTVGLAAAEAGGVTKVTKSVVRLFTAEGTLVVESDDTDVSLTLDGEDLVITGAGPREVRLKPGKYRVEARKDGKVVSRELVTVTRNGRQIVRVTAEPAAPPDDVMNNPYPPLDATWLAWVRRQTPQEQSKAVEAELQRRNPKYVGNFQTVVHEGEVTEVRVDAIRVGQQAPATHLADLTPLKAFGKLQKLSCYYGAVTTTRPLAGLKLRYLMLWDQPVSDLTGLKDMPLEELRLLYTRVSDLRPLSGMTTLRVLQLYSSPVSDLGPLRSLRLKTLNVGATNVTDLSPVRSSPLEDLGVAFQQLSDWSVLRGMKLRIVGAEGTNLSDLSVFAGMPLEILNVSRTKVTDFAPLEKLPLREWHGAVPSDRAAKILRASKTLQTIDGLPADAYWVVYDQDRKPAAAWDGEVAKLSGKGQARAVARRLKSLNPDFDGDLRPTFEGDQLTGLNLSSKKLTDVSPLRPLRLKTLNLDSNPVRDLRPLAGMPLIELSLQVTGVTDLTPLAGMTTLRGLFLWLAPVKDLSALRGLKLKAFNAGGNALDVGDLSPLEGMPLGYLSLEKCAVRDLKPLSGMNTLTTLHLHRCDVEDLSPLRGLKLTTFSYDETRVRDVSVLKDMPLTVVVCTFDPARDEAVLKGIKTLQRINGQEARGFWALHGLDEWEREVAGLPAKGQVKAVAARLRLKNPEYDGNLIPTIEGDKLTGLDLSGKKLTDVSPLRPLRLKTLNLSSNPIRDLRPLAGMPLVKLQLQGTGISDLRPLERMDTLRYLHLWEARVNDLSPLRGLKLEYLNAGGRQAAVSDLSPLEGMPLDSLCLGGSAVRDLRPLSAMKTLTRLHVHNTPVEDLSPLRGLKLQELRYSGTRVRDVSVLKGMPLTSVQCDFREARDEEVLKSLGTLRAINGQPAAEFWKGGEGRQKSPK